MKLKREIKITSAFDQRHKDYGISTCRIFFVVTGSKGAISVNFSTNWYLPSTVKEYSEIGIYKKIFPKGRASHRTKMDLTANTKPIEAWSWDIHSKKPLYDDQQSYGTCEFIGTKCYCDGSCLRADIYLKLLIEKGSEAVLDKLEEDYKHEFENKHKEETK